LSIERIAHNYLKTNELGIYIISKFYLFLIVLYLLPFFVFSAELVILGRSFDEFVSTSVNIIIVLYLLILYWGIDNLKRIGFWPAILFHAFFILNCLLMVFGRTPLFYSKGVVEDVYILITPFVIVSLFINTVVILYLFLKRRHFV